MKTLVLLAAFAAMVATAPAKGGGGGGGANPLSTTDRASIMNKAASTLTNFSRNAPTVLMTYLVGKNPNIFQSIDRGTADACLSKEASADKVDTACREALRQIIETIRSLLSSSYGLTKSMGRFDPTTVSYTKDLTRSLLMLDPQRKI